MNLGHLSMRRGFTLIELLVVIAIIGILSSVVLASLNTARDKGANASVRSNMASVRQQAELVFDSNNYSYLAPTSVCADTTIVRQLTAAYAAAGVTYTLTCGASASAWAAAAPLKGGGAFCVDSTGAAKTTQGVGSTAYTAVSGAATAALTTATTDYDCN